MIKYLRLTTAALIFLLLIPFTANAEKSLIQVSAQAKTSVQPNQVIVNYLVWTENKSSSLAQSENSKIADSIKSKLKSKFKLKDKDIESTSYQVNAQYDYNNRKRVWRGIKVTHQFSLKLKEIKKAGTAIDVVGSEEHRTQSGVNIHGIQFTHTNPEQYEQSLLEQAVKKAQQKAKILANASGVNLGRPHFIRDSNVQNFQPRPVRYSKMAMAESDMGGAPTHVQAGDLVLTKNVYIEYLIQ